MNFLFCMDSNFLNPMLVLLHSLRLHTKEKVDIYVLSTNFSQEAARILEKHCEELNFSLHIKVVKLNINFANAYYPIELFLRVLAFKFLPDVDNIMALDCDMLFFDDAKKIYDTDINDKLIASVPDRFESGDKYIVPFCKRMNIKHKYFNAGMLLMNLKKMRETWDADAIEKLIAENVFNFKLLDQDTLNTITKEDEVVILDRTCNLQPAKRRNNLNIDGAILLHYLGGVKPWNVKHPKKYELPYWQVAGPLNLAGWEKQSQRMLKKIKKLSD